MLHHTLCRATRLNTVTLITRRSLSQFYDRPTLNFLLFDTPHLVNPPEDPSTTNQVLDSAEQFVNRYHHLDPLFDANEPQFDPSLMNDRSSPTSSPVKVRSDVTIGQHFFLAHTAYHYNKQSLPALASPAPLIADARASQGGVGSVQ